MLTCSHRITTFQWVTINPIAFLTGQFPEGDISSFSLAKQAQGGRASQILWINCEEVAQGGRFQVFG